MRIAGVVLSGGLSRRMGQDKAKLELHGQSLLQRCQQQLQATSVNEVLISGRGPEHIADVYPQQGPLGGIHGVMQNSDFDGFLFVPVDMPAMSAVYLQPLLDAGSHQSTICYFDGYNLPVYIPRQPEILDYIENQLRDNGKRSVYSLLTAFPALVLPPPAEAVMQNINEPQQWQQFSNMPKG
ncbi:molybdenum cofactor guanylyltransferase [Alteromonadaceae bacterium BrNp21-10]|nr:molybdenum cofactor guanylyltransferase [Alteromonadaceae bacterium BrNp21-10]